MPDAGPNLLEVAQNVLQNKEVLTSDQILLIREAFKPSDQRRKEVAAVLKNPDDPVMKIGIGLGASMVNDPAMENETARVQLAFGEKVAKQWSAVNDLDGAISLLGADVREIFESGIYLDLDINKDVLKATPAEGARRVVGQYQHTMEKAVLLGIAKKAAENGDIPHCLQAVEAAAVDFHREEPEWFTGIVADAIDKVDVETCDDATRRILCNLKDRDRFGQVDKQVVASKNPGELTTQERIFVKGQEAYKKEQAIQYEADRIEKQTKYEQAFQEGRTRDMKGGVTGALYDFRSVTQYNRIQVSFNEVTGMGQAALQTIREDTTFCDKHGINRKEGAYGYLDFLDELCRETTLDEAIDIVAEPFYCDYGEKSKSTYLEEQDGETAWKAMIKQRIRDEVQSHIFGVLIGATEDNRSGLQTYQTQEVMSRAMKMLTRGQAVEFFQGRATNPDLAIVQQMFRDYQENPGLFTQALEEAVTLRNGRLHELSTRALQLDVTWELEQEEIVRKLRLDEQAKETKRTEITQKLTDSKAYLEAIETQQQRLADDEIAYGQIGSIWDATETRIEDFITIRRNDSKPSALTLEVETGQGSRYQQLVAERDRLKESAEPEEHARYIQAQTEVVFLDRLKPIVDILNQPQYKIPASIRGTLGIRKTIAGLKENAFTSVTQDVENSFNKYRSSYNRSITAAQNTIAIGRDDERTYVEKNEPTLAQLRETHEALTGEETKDTDLLEKESKIRNLESSLRMKSSLATNRVDTLCRETDTAISQLAQMVVRSRLQELMQREHRTVWTG
jgi:hypothetical protein